MAHHGIAQQIAHAIRLTADGREKTVALAGAGAPGTAGVSVPAGETQRRAPAVRLVSSQPIKDLTTVLFTDVEGFTALSETLSVEAVADLLSAYYMDIVDAVSAFDGAIDKFVGDGALAYWCRSRNGGAHADLAIAAVERLRTLIAERNGRTVRYPSGDAIPIRVRFGLHTGFALVGRIGAAGLASTIIGDTVNVAARLQQAAKKLASSADDRGLRGYVSRSTLEHLSDDARIGPGFDDLELPGRVDHVQARRF